MQELTVFKNKGYLRKVQKVLPILEEIAPSMVKTKVMSYDILRKKIRKEFGYKYLGSGYTAICFEIDEGRVLRIEYNYGKSGMFRWLEYAEENPSSITPRVFFRGVVKVAHQKKFLITVVEKLQPIEKSKVFKRSSLENACDNLSIFFRRKKNYEPFWEGFANSIKNGLDANKILPFNDAYQVKIALTRINDIHSGNIMFSEKRNKLILSDPLY